MSDFIAQVTAQLDLGTVETDLKELCKDRNVTFKATVDDTEIKNITRRISKDKSFQITAHIKDTSLKNIQNQLNSITKGLSIDLGSALNINGLQKTGQQVGEVISKSARKAMSEVSSKGIGQSFHVTSDMSNNVESELEKVVAKLTNNKGKISKISLRTTTSFDESTQANIERLKSATVQYTNAVGEAITKTFELKQIGIDNSTDTAIMGWVESVGTYTKSIGKAASATRAASTDINDLEKRLNAIKSVDTSKWTNASDFHAMSNHIKDAEDAMERFNAEVQKGKQADYSVLTKELKNVQSATEKAERQFNKLNVTVSEIDRVTESNKLKSWLNNNSKVYKDKNLSTSLESIARQFLSSDLDKGTFESLKKEMASYKSSASAQGLVGKDWMSSFKQSFTNIAQFTGIYSVIQNVIGEIPKQMIENVHQVDEAMTDLQMATGVTDSKAKELMNTYSEMGKELKVLGTDIAASSTEWLKQGKTIQEAENLTRDSVILSKIGDMTSEDATKTITAYMKSYEATEKEVMDFVDVISAIDMESATDVSGLSDAFNEVAANAKNAGVEAEKLLSYAAVIGETSQEGMSSVGNSLNAIFSRMGNIKLSRLKDYENGDEDLSNVETVLKKNGISLRDATGQFREFDDVLEETAQKWETLDSVSKRAVSNAFAG